MATATHSPARSSRSNNNNNNNSSGNSNNNNGNSNLKASNPSSVTRRLQQELMTLMTCGNSDISGFPCGDNLLNWVATIKGSKETVYEGLEFRLSFQFPQNYPYEPPHVTFSTPCFHPNVDQHGNICLDVLKDKWSALYDVRTILLSIQSLLGEPNNESPLNAYAASLWDNQTEYGNVLRKKYDEFNKTKK